MWRERIVRSLPYILVLLSAAGVAITEEVWLAIGALVGMWLLPSPVGNAFPEASISTDATDPNESVSEYIGRRALEYAENSAAPCHVMHGAAESHVLGCEGWLRD